jgi:NADH-quinone oxidoreductase subunit M
MSGEVNNTLSGFTDLTNHEKLVLYPVVVLIVLLGVYPMPLLNLSEASVENLLTIYSNLSALGR